MSLLKVLRNAGLVEVRRNAQRRLDRLRPEPLMELAHGCSRIERVDRARLDSLERHLPRITTPFRSSAKEHR
jgi:DNA-binding transcriptional ArsR family regulator